MTSHALPPLTFAEAGVVLQRLGDLTSELVLVGGQAIAFWVAYYAQRISLPGHVNSKDIDFCGAPSTVPAAARRLDGTHRLPEPFDNTPNTGIVEFLDARGHRRVIDFLAAPFGLGYEEVVQWAIEVDVPLPDTTATFKVMHPVHCVRSRISNVGGLSGYQTEHAIAQARASLSCAREFLRDLLDAGEVDAARMVLDLNEHIYRFAWGSPDARTAFTKFGLDAFEAILVDDRLPAAFLAKRYPDMQRRLGWKRSPSR